MVSSLNESPWLWQWWRSVFYISALHPGFSLSAQWGRIMNGGLWLDLLDFPIFWRAWWLQESEGSLVVISFYSFIHSFNYQLSSFLNLLSKFCLSKQFGDKGRAPVLLVKLDDRICINLILLTYVQLPIVKSKQSKPVVCSTVSCYSHLYVGLNLQHPGLVLSGHIL